MDIAKSLLEDPNVFFINTILKMDDNEKRIQRIKSLGIPDDKYYSFIHPSVYLASNVEIGTGTIIMPNCTVSSGVKIGNNSLVMVSSTIGHNTEIKDFVHIAAQPCIGPYVTIQEYKELGKLSALGMGAVLTKSIPNRELWIGCPAKHFKKIG